MGMKTKAILRADLCLQHRSRLLLQKRVSMPKNLLCVTSEAVEMKRHKVIVQDKVSVELVITKAPINIISKIKGLLVRLVNNDIVNGMRPKVIKRDRRWLSYRVNRKYRIVVLRKSCRVGPYYCFNHAEFDRWVNHHQSK
ncbi:ParE family toxin-like protein [Vibrio clamense]|uniref:ParE family toxin-like protein n=1 Tax=Vibrio TaxID=662 RepID=UPI003D1B0D5A